MRLNESALLIILHNVTFAAKKPRKSSSIRQYASHATNQFNEFAALDNYWPSVHWIIDFEDYMAKRTDSFNLIEYRLDDAQIAAFEEWLKTAKPTMKTALNYCAEKAIKISFTFAENNESWCVSLTGRDGNKHNSGATLTTWSEDSHEAFFMAIFKATVIFEDGKWTTRKSANRG